MAPADYPLVPEQREVQSLMLALLDGSVSRAGVLLETGLATAI